MILVDLNLSLSAPRSECVVLKPLKSPTSRHTTSTPCRKASGDEKQKEKPLDFLYCFLLFVVFCQTNPYKNILVDQSLT